jgi:hypothetical protein
MLKIYEIEGKLWQFEEGTEPAGAKEYKQKAAEPPKDKERAPTAKAAGPIARDKTAKPKNKARKAAVK